MTEMLPREWDTRGAFLSSTFLPDISTALTRPRRPKQYCLRLVIFQYRSSIVGYSTAEGRGLVSEETVVLRWWGSDTRNLVCQRS